jgi:hypothetical protein
LHRKPGKCSFEQNRAADGTNVQMLQCAAQYCSNDQKAVILSQGAPDECRGSYGGSGVACVSYSSFTCVGSRANVLLNNTVLKMYLTSRCISLQHSIVKKSKAQKYS